MICAAVMLRGLQPQRDCPFHGHEVAKRLIYKRSGVPSTASINLKLQSPLNIEIPMCPLSCAAACACSHIATSEFISATSEEKPCPTALSHLQRIIRLSVIGSFSGIIVLPMTILSQTFDNVRPWICPKRLILSTILGALSGALSGYHGAQFIEIPTRQGSSLASS